MRLRLVPVLVVWLIAPTVEPPALAAPSFGRFNGVYECFERTFHVSVELSVSGADRVSGELLVTDQLVPRGKKRPQTPVKISGALDAASGALTFETREKLYIDQNIHEPMRVRITRNESNGYFVGEVIRAQCGIFVVAPEGVREEAVLTFISRVVRPANARARIEAEYEEKIRSGYVPIELRPTGGVLWLQPYLKYADRAAGRTEQERRSLLASVNNSLERDGLMCVMGSKAVWRGDTGSAPAFGFGPTRYVIACLSNCEGIKYWASGAQGQQSHFGLLYPFPAAALNLAQTGPFRVPFHDFEWQFKKRVSDAPDPQIVVTTWQAGWFGPLSNRGTCQRALGQN
jgi:hypothetical protein